MSVPELQAFEIVETLERLVEPASQNVVAFDADGTLWTSDVGEIVFEFAVDRGLVRREAFDHLCAEAAAFDVDAEAKPSDVARALYSLYRAGTYPEPRACEVMVWCYAGMTETELKRLTDEALEEADFETTVNERILPLLTWTRERRHRAVVISASPALIVEQAARSLGFSHADVVGARAATVGDTILATMEGSLPYGPGKAEAGRRAIGAARWLASCGDSLFDLEMLRAADLAIGVRPKPELERALADVPGAVVLQGDG